MPRLKKILSPVQDDPQSGRPDQEYSCIVLVWLAVSAVLTTLTLRHLSVPGLYYDEAVFAGLARDFLTGNAHSLHMPGTQAVQLFGHPFPLYVQSYLGAVKAWLIIPGFAIFGPSVAVLRLTALFWSLIGLLFFMLWTHRFLGLPAALLAAPLLGLDPSFYLISVLDWGSLVPSFLCRFCGCYFLLLWWQGKKARYGFLAALLLGVGFFNKIDFALFLLGCGAAAAAVYGGELAASVRKCPGRYLVLGLGFFLGASPMALKIWMILQAVSTGQISRGAHETLEKFNTALAMYDGSYMYRLMLAGGRFETMFTRPTPVWSPFGCVVAVSVLVLICGILSKKGAVAQSRKTCFLLLSGCLISAGVFLLPGAVRLHHATLVYPFPHLLVVSALLVLWRWSPAARLPSWCLRGLATGMALLALSGHLLAISQTEELMETTGGRGTWSDAVATFCNSLKGQTGLAVVSLDWGFNEQLNFLGCGAPLSEPFWSDQPIEPLPDTVYLVHPPEYSLFPQGVEFFAMARRQDPRGTTIQPYTDRLGGVSFYAIRFSGIKAAR